MSKKITVIPIVKDEGQAGDRDYLQWDTVSMMSLLDVFVIFAYYNKADKANNKITNQQFDNDYIIAKINEIKNFHSSALHWNLNEIDNNFDKLLVKVKSNYAEIETKTGVKLHNFKGIDNFRQKLSKSSEKFKIFSREKAAQAQAREIVTNQPKEALSFDHERFAENLKNCTHKWLITYDNSEYKYLYINKRYCNRNDLGSHELHKLHENRVYKLKSYYTNF